ncbi:MAG: hypothetical protein ACRCZ2_06590 [Fusobacteriaceae bacterium]
MNILISLFPVLVLLIFLFIGDFVKSLNNQSLSKECAFVVLLVVGFLFHSIGWWN